MKKIITLISALMISAAGFAETFFNFTIPVTIGFHEQEGCTNEMKDTHEFLFTPGFTAEVFKTFDGSFGLGIKGGLKWDHGADLDVEEYSDTLECDFFSWYLAPSLGWAMNSSATKKKINVYPLILERMTYSDPKIDCNKTGMKDFVVTNLKYGASFSWQWGQGTVQNGFEFGFDMDWDSFMAYDGNKTGEDGWGFDIWLGYKMSVMSF